MQCSRCRRNREWNWIDQLRSHGNNSDKKLWESGLKWKDTSLTFWWIDLQNLMTDWIYEKKIRIKDKCKILNVHLWNEELGCGDGFETELWIQSRHTEFMIWNIQIVRWMLWGDGSKLTRNQSLRQRFENQASFILRKWMMLLMEIEQENKSKWQSASPEEKMEDQEQKSIILRRNRRKG